MSTNKSIDLNFDKQLSNITILEQKQLEFDVNNLINIESNHNERKSITKNSYQIPSPTIFLPNKFSSISQSTTPIDNHRNLLTFNQPNSFYLKTHLIDHTQEFRIHSDQISMTSINSLNLIDLSQENVSTQQSNIILPRFIDKSIFSMHNSKISSNDISINLSQDFKSSLSNENIQSELPINTSSFQISSQSKLKSEFESLWKTKLPLKTLLSIANRDEAQALKNRKPIDYHLFLNNKFQKKNSFLQYDEQFDKKFISNNKYQEIKQLNKQNYQENRKLYKRLLNTMGICKPMIIKKKESMNLIKQIKPKHRIEIEVNTLSSINDSISTIEKPFLITYQAIPISIFNK